MTDNNEIMQIEEVMEYLNIGKNTMYGLLKSGELNAFKIGKVWKIPRKSVEEYVEKALKKKT
ncbi:MAG: helix-turn-helix domain-containing protein [Ruminococcus sp.]|nr:helix-turn-helix domain-containing protein [Ruminococcus sp.]